MENKRFFGMISNMLKEGPNGRLVHKRHIQQLHTPSRRPALSNIGGKVRSRIVSISVMPDIDHARNLRVRVLSPFRAFSKIEDLLDVARQPCYGLRVLGGKPQGAAAVHSLGGQRAARDGTDVADVDEGAGGNKGGAGEEREEGVVGDDGANVGLDEGEDMLSRWDGHDGL